jgi:spore coat protein A
MNRRQGIEVEGRTMNIRGRQLIRQVCAVAALLAWAASPQPAAAQTTMVLPDYSLPLLTPASQAPVAWTNVIPNALASYYTYVPYSNADAVALGFPASCGNKALATPADVASTEDCYTITMQSNPQQLALPATAGFGGPGLLDANGVPFGPPAATPLTRAYGYGSGGQNWIPPGAAVAVTGNAPAPFTNGQIGTAGIWHWPAPTIRGTKGRPIRVQWLNELPNVPPVGFDPSLDCGPNTSSCFPYNRVVVHAHGAHVQGDSDGNAVAWFTPNFLTTGMNYALSPYGPPGTYRYPMDQEAATVWYHDHAMGLTHLNTEMGLAGFFPITDANEQALIATNILPTGNYELGFALQDRYFDINGQFAMPDYPIYNLNSPGCTLTVNGLADPATCARVDWMKDPADGHLVPYVPGSPFLLDPINAGAPFPAASTSLEYFGNMPVVNGVTYGKFDVEPRRYRMRFIGGTDSRTWIMQLVDRTTLAVIPFWQIGTEQGFLNNPVQRTSMALMPGERLDVLVDFTGITPGSKIVMQNLGPDTPYAGPFNPVIPSVDIPEIMEFNVVGLVGVDNILPPSAATSLRAPIVPLVKTPTTPIRNVSLVEKTDQFGRILPTIDGRGFMPMGVPATELVRQNDTEEWDIINTTVDAHPMHLHLVAFQLINRQQYDPATYVPVVTDTVNQIFTQPSYTPLGPVVLPTADEAGWKDTIDCPPGYVTRVRAKFDIASDLYVWHCHILSHEEHDMMRPLVVFADGVCGADNGAALTATPTKLCTTGVPSLVSGAGPWTWTCQQQFGGVSSGTCSAALATLTPTPASPQKTGTSVTFTGGTVGGGTTAYEYRFYWRVDRAAKWTLGRGYLGTASWSWNTTGLAMGTYNILLQVRPVGSTAPFTGQVTLNYKLTSATPATGVTLAALPVSPKPAGTLVNFTAGATGGDPAGPYEYRFAWRKMGTATWTEAPAYTTTTTWSWDTAALALTPGTYYIRVYARHVGSPLVFEAQRSMTYLLSAPAPATSAVLVAVPSSPSVAGTSVTFTTTPTGGDAGPYEFLYQYRNTAGGVWTNGRGPAYGVAAWTWNTAAPAMPAGTYAVRVYVRHVGSPVQFEVIRYTTYVLQ